MSKTHKCPNCSIVGECIFIRENDEEKVHCCKGCGFEWVYRAGEIEVIG